jgi:hypothetical protein
MCQRIANASVITAFRKTLESEASMLTRACSFALLAALFLLQAGPGRSADDKADDGLVKKLDKKISLPQGIEANTPLKEALEFIAASQGVTIILDTDAFKKAKIAKVDEQPVGLKPVKDVKLGDVVKQLVGQAKGTYRVEKDRIVIVPKAK